MPTAVIQANYDALAKSSHRFAEKAEEIRNLSKQVKQCVEHLQAGDWIGQGAEKFFAEMHELVLPGVERLGSALNAADQATQRIVNILRDGEENAGHLFRGGNGFSSGGATSGGAAGILESVVSMFTTMPGNTPLPNGHPVQLSAYQNGVNGWSTLPVLNRPYVAQDGPTCRFYAPINAAIAAGYDITQAQADKIVGGYRKWNPFFVDQQQSIVNEVGAGYTLHSFLNMASFTPRDRAADEKFFIDNIKAGRPIVVNTATENTFGVASTGHTYTVLGVKTDAQGRMTSVLVNTNWARDPFYEIPADSLLKDLQMYDTAIAVNPRSK